MLKKYSHLATLFDYPCEKTEEILLWIDKTLKEEYPTAVIPFGSFQEIILKMDQQAREEYFVRTFEVEALVSMDIGYILFGEDYKRGDFLAMMQQEQIMAGNDPGSELSDHLPNVLRLLPLMDDKNLAEELVCSIILPAIREILNKIGDTDNFYRYAFKTLLMIMENDFSGLPYEEYQVKPASMGYAGEEYTCGADFLQEIGKPKF